MAQARPRRASARDSRREPKGIPVAHRCPPCHCSICDVYLVRRMTPEELAGRGAAGRLVDVER